MSLRLRTIGLAMNRKKMRATNETRHIDSLKTHKSTPAKTVTLCSTHVTPGVNVSDDWPDVKCKKCLRIGGMELIGPVKIEVQLDLFEES